MGRELYVYLYFPNRKGKYVCINTHTHIKRIVFFFISN